MSKLSRFLAQDRADIVGLARHRRVGDAAFRVRAAQALCAYVGSIDQVRGSIDLASRILEDYVGTHGS